MADHRIADMHQYHRGSQRATHRPNGRWSSKGLVSHKAPRCLRDVWYGKLKPNHGHNGIPNHHQRASHTSYRDGDRNGNNHFSNTEPQQAVSRVWQCMLRGSYRITCSHVDGRVFVLIGRYLYMVVGINGTNPRRYTALEKDG